MKYVAILLCHKHMHVFKLGNSNYMDFCAVTVGAKQWKGLHRNIVDYMHLISYKKVQGQSAAAL